MRAMTEIEWLDGRVTKVPELALGDAFGESVQASSISGSTTCWRAFGSRCAIMSRIRAHYGRPGFCGATRRAEFVSAGSVAG